MNFDPFTFDPVPARGKLEKVTTGPFSCEAKLDGIRQIVTITSDGEIMLTGRRNSVKTGQKLNKAAWVPHLVEAFRSLKVKDLVIDGELYVPGGTSNDVVSIFGSAKDKAILYQQIKTPLHYRFFDILQSGDSATRDRKLRHRYVAMSTLDALFEDCPYVDSTPIFYNAESYTGGLVGSPYQIIEACYGKAIEMGFEGLVVKSLDGLYDKNAWAKVKPQETFDYIFCGIDESTSETYSGWGAAAIRLGLYCHGTLVELTRCSGMTEQWRAEFFKNHGLYVGQVVEVVAQQQFPTGALRHPRFKRLRPDIPAVDQTIDKYNLKVGDIART